MLSLDNTKIAKKTVYGYIEMGKNREKSLCEATDFPHLISVSTFAGPRPLSPSSAAASSSSPSADSRDWANAVGGGATGTTLGFCEANARSSKTPG